MDILLNEGLWSLFLFIVGSAICYSNRNSDSKFIFIIGGLFYLAAVIMLIVMIIKFIIVPK